MKFGYRKPNLKKSIKARTTGKIKRTVKKAINPVYGQKGIGYIKNPEKAIKNSIYHQTTIDTTIPIKNTIFDKTSKKPKKNTIINTPLEENLKTDNNTKIKKDIQLSPTMDKIINIISYIIAIIIVIFIIIFIGSFLLGIIQGIINN